MVKALTFMAGAAVGYVLGTKAGRERYEQIVAGAKNLKDQPMVSQAQTKAKDLVGAGTRAVKTKLGGEDSTTAALPSEVGSSSPSSSRRTTSTGSAATSQV
jgi:hypothetical protein